jgi:PadR family transcriptional regulator PadR
MHELFDNWSTQIRKGYLELCILTLIERDGRLYGFDMLEHLSDAGMPVKEGTLYPLLNRMAIDGLLTAQWETERAKGHPRKFYALTRGGRAILSEMTPEFERMYGAFRRLNRRN